MNLLTFWLRGSGGSSGLIRPLLRMSAACDRAFRGRSEHTYHRMPAALCRSESLSSSAGKHSSRIRGIPFDRHCSTSCWSITGFARQASNSDIVFALEARSLTQSSSCNAVPPTQTRNSILTRSSSQQRNSFRDRSLGGNLLDREQILLPQHRVHGCPLPPHFGAVVFHPVSLLVRDDSVDMWGNFQGVEPLPTAVVDCQRRTVRDGSCWARLRSKMTWILVSPGSPKTRKAC